MSKTIAVARRSWRALTMATVGTALVGGAALAGGSTTTLRDRSGVSLGDAAFDREDVAVVWREPLAGGPSVRIRTSDAAGTVFAATELVVEDARQPSVDICAHQVFVAYAKDYGASITGRWAIDLRTRPVSATGFTGAAVSSGEFLARDRFAARFARLRCAHRPGCCEPGRHGPRRGGRQPLGLRRLDVRG